MLTRALIVINIIAYIWETTTGNVNSGQSLVNHGALFGPYVVGRGEWWRVFTSEFLHGGLLHIATNMIALYQVGTFVELLYGRVRFAIVYFLAIVGAGVSVIWFNFDVPTIGASGAVFGLFGALLAAGLRLGKPGRALVQQSAGVIILNLILGFTLFAGFVSNAGHIGGLLAGMLAGFVLFMGPRYNEIRAREAQPETAAIPAGTQLYEPAPPVHE
ncbi:MAG: rhomboid family intramembrane serine protease [Candidatus Velthaea sp.]